MFLGCLGPLTSMVIMICSFDPFSKFTWCNSWRHVVFIWSPNDLIFCICLYIWMANKFAKWSFHFRCTKNAFFIFRVPKVGSFVKDVPNIWCQFEPTHFCIILDHLLLTNHKSFHVKCFLCTSAEKDKLPPIQLERGEIWTTSAW